MLNLSATLNAGRLLYNPALCLPHLSVKTFDQIPIPLIFPGHDSVEIKGVVLDKDNCFAKDKDDKLWEPYSEVWARLLDQYSAQNILIVSNSAGTDDDVNHEQAKTIEKNVGVTVLRHSTKKPGCHHEIMSYFRQLGINNANEIAVIGDRLLTDIVMANTMGSWGVWISEGVVLSRSILPSFERELYSKLSSYGTPPVPQSN